jgi:hypothetical protein
MHRLLLTASTPIGWVHALRVIALLSVAALTNIAKADSPALSFTTDDLSRAERRSLEAIACRPFNVKLQASYAMWFGTNGDRPREFDAHARCAPHAKIYNHAVVFIRPCKFDGSWDCDPEQETILATFADRRIEITSEGTSLTEAYRVVSHFVSNRLFEPATVIDLFETRKTLPLDNCRVRALDERQLELKCQLVERRVERIRSEGTVRYREI